MENMNKEKWFETDKAEMTLEDDTDAEWSNLPYPNT
jgi:hypothetical protein